MKVCIYSNVWAIKDNISLTTEELNTILCKEGIEIFTKETLN